MGVIVTHNVTGDGPVIQGDKVGLVVVHVDSYDAGVMGRGTVVAQAP